MKSKQDELIAVFRSVFLDLENKEDDEIKLFRKEQSHSWDSSAHLLLLSCIEEKFNITISDDDAGNIDSFKYALAIISN